MWGRVRASKPCRAFIHVNTNVPHLVPAHTHRSFAAMCCSANLGTRAASQCRAPPPIPDVQPLQPLGIVDREANHLFRALVCALAVRPASASRVADRAGLLQVVNVLTPLRLLVAHLSCPVARLFSFLQASRWQSHCILRCRSREV